MRENRLYGSEGGEAKSLPYPYHLSTKCSTDESPKTGRVVTISAACRGAGRVAAK